MDFNTTLLAAIIFAFIIAFIFSMFGQGGGSVYSPMLILLGYTVLIATSTSLVLNLITSLSAGYIFYRKKMIDYKTSLIFAPGIIIGAFSGGALSKFFDTTVLLWVYVVVLLVLGARMIYSYWKRKRSRKRCQFCPLRRLCLSQFLVLLWGFFPVYWELVVVFS